MKNNTSTIFRSVIISVFICLFAVLNSYGGAYEALKGLNDIKVVFDVRAKAPKSAWIYLGLIHKTFKDKSIREVTDKPEISMYAANLMGRDPATILPEIKQVEKGWISLIGYQGKGYAFVPAY